MDLQAIREFLTRNRDNEEVKTFLAELRGVPSLADVQRLATENNDIKTWLQSEKDRFFSKGLETWKEKTLPQVLEEEIKKCYPEETPEQRELRELRQEIEREKQARLRESLKNKAKDLAIEKKLPVTLVDFFIGEDEEKTTENLKTLEQVWSESLKGVVGDKFKEHGRDPHKSSSPQQKIVNPWKKETRNLTLQAKLKKEQPELAKKLQEQAKE